MRRTDDAFEARTSLCAARLPPPPIPLPHAHAARDNAHINMILQTPSSAVTILLPLHTLIPSSTEHTTAVRRRPGVSVLLGISLCTLLGKTRRYKISFVYTTTVGMEVILLNNNIYEPHEKHIEFALILWIAVGE